MSPLSKSPPRWLPTTRTRCAKRWLAKRGRCGNKTNNSCFLPRSSDECVFEPYGCSPKRQDPLAVHSMLLDTAAHDPCAFVWIRTTLFCTHSLLNSGPSAAVSACLLDFPAQVEVAEYSIPPFTSFVRKHSPIILRVHPHRGEPGGSHGFLPDPPPFRLAPTAINLTRVSGHVWMSPSIFGPMKR